MSLSIATLSLIFSGAALMAFMLRMADREGVVAPPVVHPGHEPVSREMEPARSAVRNGQVRPVRLRHGALDGPAERSFAFKASGDEILLAGPGSLSAGDLIFLEIEGGLIRAQGRVATETPAGHKAVRVEHVWAAEEGAFERWQSGVPVATS